MVLYDLHDRDGEERLEWEDLIRHGICTLIMNFHNQSVWSLRDPVFLITYV